MGVSPFIRRADGLYIYTSQLSPHVRDLIDQGEATCMLCADEGDSQNIWARNRLKFSVEAVEIARDDVNFDKLCDDFTSAHGPTMDLIRNFTDFHMIRLTPRKGVLVLGFAKAFTVSGANFDIKLILVSLISCQCYQTHRYCGVSGVALLRCGPGLLSLSVAKRAVARNPAAGQTSRIFGNIG